MLERLEKKRDELEHHIAGLYAEAKNAEAKLEVINEMIEEEKASVAVDVPEVETSVSGTNEEETGKVSRMVKISVQP